MLLGWIQRVQMWAQTAAGRLVTFGISGSETSVAIGYS